MRGRHWTPYPVPWFFDSPIPVSRFRVKGSGIRVQCFAEIWVNGSPHLAHLGRKENRPLALIKGTVNTHLELHRSRCCLTYFWFGCYWVEFMFLINRQLIDLKKPPLGLTEGRFLGLWNKLFYQSGGYKQTHWFWSTDQNSWYWLAKWVGALRTVDPLSRIPESGKGRGGSLVRERSDLSDSILMPCQSPRIATRFVNYQLRFGISKKSRSLTLIKERLSFLETTSGVYSYFKHWWLLSRFHDFYEMIFSQLPIAWST